MLSTHNPIRGILLTYQPAAISRCGMSQAKFAVHRTSKRWYEVSIEGSAIGSPLEFDFYRYDISQGPRTKSRAKTQELSKV